MKLIDNILIFCVGLSVFFLSGFLYGGTQTQFEILKNNVSQSIAIRSLIYGLIGAVLLFGLRFLFYEFFGDSLKNPTRKQLFLSSLFFGVLTALAGSLFFFYN